MSNFKGFNCTDCVKVHVKKTMGLQNKFSKWVLGISASFNCRMAVFLTESLSENNQRGWIFCFNLRESISEATRGLRDHNSRGDESTQRNEPNIHQHFSL